MLKSLSVSSVFKSSKVLILSSCLFFVTSQVSGQQQKYPYQLFSANEVTLLDGVFKQAEQTDLKYMLAMNTDRLLAPYLREAGLKAKAESYTNWENTGLDGHIGGHYLTALSLMYADS